jgi:hypothetical protein
LAENLVGNRRWVRVGDTLPFIAESILTAQLCSNYTSNVGTTAGATGDKAPTRGAAAMESFLASFGYDWLNVTAMNRDLAFQRDWIGFGC